MPLKTAGLRRPRGFTTIELMVVIAIILVLMGLVVFGYRRIATGSQENQTRTILERLRNMQSTVTSNKTASQKFYQLQIPAIYSDYTGPVGTGTPTAEWDSVRAAAADSQLRTAMILKLLQSSVEAKSIFDELPTNRKKSVFLNTTTGAPAAAAAAGVSNFVIPIDAWGNPILFVFDNWPPASGVASSLPRPLAGGAASGGITEVTSASAKGYWEPAVGATFGNKDPTYAYTRPSDYTSNLGNAIRSPDRQPFWVSAGPDGNFQTNDDNVYSFDN